ncbi:MAG TPA: phosphotransferase [Halanaerobiales bacterium]|nr:phosphotransferase [Halanaerobiales bacterium]
MMKLSTMKTIVDTVDEEWNSSFGEKIAGLWDYDEGTVKYFRSSANFIFIFRREGEDYYLRFNRSDEREKDSIEEEIRLLNYLNDVTSNIVKPIKSINNKYIESVKTDLGEYYAVVFKGLKGKQYEIEDIDTEQYYIWGKALGNLHKLINTIPKDMTIKRNSWKDHLNFIEDNLSEEEILAKRELEEVKRWVDSLEITDNNYGLIHFDFELDNLRWEDNVISILDFDDCSYYWYVADIAFALRDLFEDSIDLTNSDFQEFIKGYESEFKIDKELLNDLSWFMRFHNLLSYTKLLRSIDILDYTDIPSWLLGLKKKLRRVVNNYRNSF